MRKSVVLFSALLVVAACRKPALRTTDLKAENKVALRQVRLYYESPDMLLVPESRNVDLPENPAGALSLTVRELVKGSASSAVPRLLPPDTVVRGSYLLPNGAAFIDLGGPTLAQGWGTGSHQELMAVYSLVQTVAANFPQVKTVRILVNGEPAETLGGHISLAKALVPMNELVDPRQH